MAETNQTQLKANEAICSLTNDIVNICNIEFTKTVTKKKRVFYNVSIVLEAVDGFIIKPVQSLSNAQIEYINYKYGNMLARLEDNSTITRLARVKFYQTVFENTTSDGIAYESIGYSGQLRFGDIKILVLFEKEQSKIIDDANLSSTKMFDIRLYKAKETELKELGLTELME